jgi:hypothetical protein
MSTRSSIAYEQDKYHLYSECFANDFVYLSQDAPVEFEANQDEVMVAIPTETMDKICEEWLKYRGKQTKGE